MDDIPGTKYQPQEQAAEHHYIRSARHTGGSRVGRAITLSTGLDPHKGILERIAGVSRGANTEAGADDVAPVTPGVLLRGLDAIPG